MAGLFSSEEQRKRIAWGNATPVSTHDPNYARKDAFGWWIVWDEYGNRNSEYGWEIDHIQPTALGGGDTAANLRALHWRNNASLGGLLAGNM